MLGRMKLRGLVSLVALALLAGGCSSSSDDEPKADPAKKGSSEKLVEISPVTGLPLKGRPDNPVFVVKIENTANGSPQYGLNRADMVVEELVEGGLTRLAAFYYSTLPKNVGHVRSMRATDIGIASPVAGQIVASGGAPKTYRIVKKAGVKVFSEDHGAPGFSSDPAKSRPYNRMINLQRLNRKAKVRDIPGPYLSWTPPGAKPSPSASASAAPPKKATKAAVKFSGGTRTTWRLAGKTWQRTNGHAARGQDFAADTLIVMFCKVGDAGYRDPAGNPVPETIIKGTGRAVILHGNEATETTWHKSSLDSQVRFTGKDGEPVTITPGHVWFEMVPKGAGKLALG
ncbi:DUF3048 domain-containing protein [Aeromicrobium terrae]|uniref:DUF3048 domain-containing protein n=2 Tax=Aeromicrobium terrae TaxID=2498846 RepID=A0A5C8NLT6_9ACTN|nr:DUF3048 domain-containing protein [Aeromicrobium terrae]